VYYGYANVPEGKKKVSTFCLLIGVNWY